MDEEKKKSVIVQPARMGDVMRLFTILKDIIEAIKKKQDEDWTRLGTSTGTVQYDLTGYTEVLVEVRFGGVVMSQICPLVTLTTSGVTLFVGWYMQGQVYVLASTTSAKISVQPKGYTATLVIYAR